jgi:hypothetical protein
LVWQQQLYGNENQGNFRRLDGYNGLAKQILHPKEHITVDHRKQAKYRLRGML